MFFEYVLLFFSQVNFGATDLLPTQKNSKINAFWAFSTFTVQEMDGCAPYQYK